MAEIKENFVSDHVLRELAPIKTSVRLGPLPTFALLLTQWGGWISTPPLDDSNRSPLTGLKNTVTSRTELSRIISDFSKEVLQRRVVVKQGHIKSSNA
jgi:hypothetical protein